MASTTLPTSSYVSSYSDKTDEWVRARLEFQENNELVSSKGSIPRRKEIRELRVEVMNRKKAALAIAQAANGAPAATQDGAAAPAMQPQTQHARR